MCVCIMPDNEIVFSTDKYCVVKCVYPYHKTPTEAYVVLCNPQGRREVGLRNKTEYNDFKIDASAKIIIVFRNNICFRLSFETTKKLAQIEHRQKTDAALKLLNEKGFVENYDPSDLQEKSFKNTVLNTDWTCSRLRPGNTEPSSKRQKFEDTTLVRPRPTAEEWAQRDRARILAETKKQFEDILSNHVIIPHKWTEMYDPHWVFGSIPAPMGAELSNGGTTITVTPVDAPGVRYCIVNGPGTYPISDGIIKIWTWELEVLKGDMDKWVCGVCRPGIDVTQTDLGLMGMESLGTFDKREGTHLLLVEPTYDRIRLVLDSNDNTLTMFNGDARVGNLSNIRGPLLPCIGFQNRTSKTIKIHSGSAGAPNPVSTAEVLPSRWSFKEDDNCTFNDDRTIATCDDEKGNSINVLCSNENGFLESGIWTWEIEVLTVLESTVGFSLYEVGTDGRAVIQDLNFISKDTPYRARFVLDFTDHTLTMYQDSQEGYWVEEYYEFAEMPNSVLPCFSIYKGTTIKIHGSICPISATSAIMSATKSDMFFDLTIPVLLNDEQTKHVHALCEEEQTASGPKYFPLGGHSLIPSGFASNIKNAAHSNFRVNQFSIGHNLVQFPWNIPMDLSREMRAVRMQTPQIACVYARKDSNAQFSTIGLRLKYASKLYDDQDLFLDKLYQSFEALVNNVNDVLHMKAIQGETDNSMVLQFQFQYGRPFQNIVQYISTAVNTDDFFEKDDFGCYTVNDFKIRDCAFSALVTSSTSLDSAFYNDETFSDEIDQRTRFLKIYGFDKEEYNACRRDALCLKQDCKTQLVQLKRDPTSTNTFVNVNVSVNISSWKENYKTKMLARKNNAVHIKWAGEAAFDDWIKRITEGTFFAAPTELNLPMSSHDSSEYEAASTHGFSLVVFPTGARLYLTLKISDIMTSYDPFNFDNSGRHKTHRGAKSLENDLITFIDNNKEMLYADIADNVTKSESFWTWLEGVADEYGFCVDDTLHTVIKGSKSFRDNLYEAIGTKLRAFCAAKKPLTTLTFTAYCPSGREKGVESTAVFLQASFHIDISGWLGDAFITQEEKRGGGEADTNVMSENEDDGGD